MPNGIFYALTKDYPELIATVTLKNQGDLAGESFADTLTYMFSSDGNTKL
ncbi:hypothetical protein [endosymbiont 'TC1' of Trimyema compressum]|nr:hypothetical protein [endosymbiont 'TC1' of Trimyema compressum]